MRTHLTPNCSEIPNYDKMIPILLEHEIDALPDHCKLTPGTCFSLSVFPAKTGANLNGKAFL